VRAAVSRLGFGRFVVNTSAAAVLKDRTAGKNWPNTAMLNAYRPIAGGEDFESWFIAQPRLQLAS
jgi:hypothetical protein